MELWDLYDEQWQKTGETAVRGEKLPEGRYHMVVEKRQILYGSDVAAPTIFRHGRTVSVLNTVGSGLPWREGGA